MNDAVLSVRDLSVHFQTDGGVLRAVDEVSFDLRRGETLAIVGESGAGKSVTAASILRLVEADGGEVIFDGSDLRRLPLSAVREIRGRRIAMVFQDPAASLDPYISVGAQMTEMTRLHLGHGRNEAKAHAIRMLQAVGIPDAAARFDAHPHELSGGMRQRVVTAIALSCEPEILIADEPTTALDVTVQAQILDLLNEMRSRIGMSMILITHDLGVVARMADRVAVMYAGRLFEEAPAAELFARPANPYTAGLLKSTRVLSEAAGGELYQIPGAPPDLGDLPPGCPFSDRCARSEAVCRAEPPRFVEVTPGHRSLCHFAEDVYAASFE